MDVNLMGVVYGTEVFAPLIESHGEGGHFVNTASMAGMIGFPRAEPYCATKFAVVAMSEGWHGQLAAKNIGVSVLCPGFVQTRIYDSFRNKPARYGAADPSPIGIGETLRDTQAMVMAGIPTEPVGQRVVEAIKDNDLYIFTHTEFRGAVEARFAAIMAAFDKSEKSKALSVLAKREMTPLPGRQAD
jgi:NAD(P)-dependent dehydrogenase (short-subunit alcohol dehydrogenase family)